MPSQFEFQATRTHDGAPDGSGFLVEATLTASSLTSSGFVVDFGELALTARGDGRVGIGNVGLRGVSVRVSDPDVVAMPSPDACGLLSVPAATISAWPSNTAKRQRAIPV
jgi:hypothetical protein